MAVELEPPSPAAPARGVPFLTAGALAVCLLYLWANLFADAKTAYLLGGDQAFFWMNGLRLLHGEAIYKDFFEFTPPGTDLLYLAVFKALGPRIWTPNVVVLALASVLSMTCLGISRRLMRPSEAALAAALYLVVVIGVTLDATHHWFSVLAVMLAVSVLLGGKTRWRLALCGALLAAATFFTQTRGPAAALAIAAWLSWYRFQTRQSWADHLTDLALLFTALVITWAILSSYYIATLGLGQLWFYQVTFVHEYLVSGWNALSIGFPARPSLPTLQALARWVFYLARWSFAYLVLPGVYLLSLWRCSRISRRTFSERDAGVALLTFVGGALLAEVGLSPSWFRFFCVSLPGVVLLVGLTVNTGKARPWVISCLWIGLVGLAAGQTLSKHVIFSVVVRVPAGIAATSSGAAAKLRWLADRTRPGDLLLQAEWPGVYLPLSVRNPIYLDVVMKEGAVPLGYLARSERQLDAASVRYVVESPSQSVEEFRDYLARRYRLVRKFPDQDEVWERLPGGPYRDEGAARAAD
jgi:hypothetical protein